MNRTLKNQLLVVATSVLATACGNSKRIVKPASATLKPQPVALVAPGASAPDPLAKDQWTSAKLGLGQVWADEIGTRRVSVAIVSSGIDYNHPDLAANIWRNTAELRSSAPAASPADGVDNDGNGYKDDFLGYDVIDEDGLPFDTTGPGTAAAGVIAAGHDNGIGIKGIVKKVSLIPVRYLDSNGLTTVPRLVQALKYVAAVKPDVVLLHLANVDFTKKSAEAAKAEEAAVGEVLAKIQSLEIPVVVSAGNTGADVGRSKSLLKKIGSYPNVVLVTSVDEQDKRPFIANFGMSLVHTAAPGEKVITTMPGGGYGPESGTVVAAAHVAGAFALLQSKYFGRYGYEQFIKGLLSEKGSDRLAGLELETIGGNRLNVSKLLSAIEP